MFPPKEIVYFVLCKVFIKMKEKNENNKRFNMIKTTASFKQCSTNIKIDIQTNRTDYRLESLEIKPHIYGQLIFNKDAKTIQWGKRPSFQ